MGDLVIGLEDIEKAASVCQLCHLHQTRTNPVFAKGNPSARLMICGMIPGPDENKVGSPFVGRAGQLLDKILGTVIITLDDVYITNLVKCWLRPGLVPDSICIANCLPYIVAQITIIQPRVIVTLGQLASVNLVSLPPKTSMSSMRGRAHVYNHKPRIDIVPTYHPSYLLRNGGEKSNSYPKVIKDFELALYILAQKE